MQAFYLGNLLRIWSASDDSLYLFEVLLSMRSYLLGCASSNVIADFRVVVSPVNSYCLDEAEVLSTCPSSNFFTFPVGFSFSGILFPVAFVREAHLDLADIDLCLFICSFVIFIHDDS